MSPQLQDRPSAKDHGPSRSVLLVDDEALVRTAMHRFLARRGWTVSEAVDGECARALLDPIAGIEFDLVICDLQMPRLSGREFYGWLARARICRLLGRLRRRRRRSGRHLGLLVTRKDLARVVERAMANLPEEQRTAIVLKEYHGLTFQEIADLVGCPLSTVKTRLYQGLTVLRRELAKSGTS